MTLADKIAQLTGSPVRALEVIGGQHSWQHYRAALADGRYLFAKAATRSHGEIMRSEARSLRWLAEPGVIAVPEVIGYDGNILILSWVPPGPADVAAAERFGRDLAALHASGADCFGAPWPGFIASLPLDNTPAHGAEGWAEWYARCRLLPFLRRAADAGTLTRAETGLVESVTARIGELAGPAEPPSRIHGDCWSGNVLWSAGRGWLIDPAAHGGHRETDLAMLALFGAPYLERIVAAYNEVSPLAEGWRSRVALHQLHPLLVHVCLFGAGYAGSVRDAARAALAA
jgi:fructosamine-3-kinase